MKTSALFDLSGRVAVVTGGNGGIGRGIALGLAEAGAAVAVFGRNEEKNQQVLSELKAIGPSAVSMKVDVTNRPGLEPALDRVEREFGGIDILVNNAGNVSLSGGVLNEKPEDWDSVIETQLTAVFLLSKLVARSMLRRKGGKIINIGSMYSFFGSGLIPSYSAAKGAIVQLTKSMAIELAPHNIQVNAIAPGWIETDMTAPVRDHAHERRDPCANTSGSMGKTRGDCRDGGVSGITGFGLRHRSDNPSGWRLRDSMRVQTSQRPWPATGITIDGEVNSCEGRQQRLRAT